MRLGFHYHVPAMSADGLLRMPGHQGVFLEALARECQEVVCFLHSPREMERKQMDYTVRGSNVRLVELSAHTTVPRRMMASRTYARIVHGMREEMDVMLLRGPSPLLPVLAEAVGPMPTALLLVGDMVAGLRDLRQPPWRQLGIRLFWLWNRRGQDRVARRALTLVNSRDLFEQLRPWVPRLFEVRTTTLTAGDFFCRNDTCQNRPFRLLYAGRMDRGKGLVEMVKALATLVQQGEEVVFDWVGWPERGDAILDEAITLARQCGVADRIKYHGGRPLGTEYFDFYRQADIFVIASRTTEGFPRVIWEAMAHSVPVVATQVGSIPRFVTDGALLVAPNDASALANAIRQLIHSPAERQRLIVRGRALASEVTLEKQVGEMVKHIRSWVTNPR